MATSDTVIMTAAATAAVQPKSPTPVHESLIAVAPNTPTDARQRHLIIVEGDVEPTLYGPFVNDAQRDAVAVTHRQGDHDKADGIFKLDLVVKDGIIMPVVEPYSGAELDT